MANDLITVRVSLAELALIRDGLGQMAPPAEPADAARRAEMIRLFSKEIADANARGA